MTPSALSTAPAAVEIWIPCTADGPRPRSRARSRALPPPRARPPRRAASARRSASGTRTPGTSLAMNSACRRLSSGVMRRQDRNPRRRRSARGTARARATSNTGCVIANSAPASTLYSNRRNSSSRSSAPGFTATPMWNAVGAPMRLAADVEPAVQPRDDVREADRIDVEDRRRVRIVADLRRIAGDEQHVADAHRVRAEQVRLHAEQVAIAAGVVEDRSRSRPAAARAPPPTARSCARWRAGRPGC